MLAPVFGLNFYFLLCRLAPVFGHVEELNLSDNNFTWYYITFT